MELKIGFKSRTFFKLLIKNKMKFFGIVLSLVISADAVKVKQEDAAKAKGSGTWALCNPLDKNNYIAPSQGYLWDNWGTTSWCCQGLGGSGSYVPLS